MAKIKSVIPVNIPSKVVVGSGASEIIVHTAIEFHSIDLKLEMEYLLYLYAYDVRGKTDVQILLNNWDESSIASIPQETEDDVLGKTSTKIIARTKDQNVETSVILKMGSIDSAKHYEYRYLRIFAEIIPAIGQASKWSETLQIDVEH